MKVYLINPPASNGIKMVREGRCMQRKGAWTTVWPPVTLATMAAMLSRDGNEVKLDDCIVEEISFKQLRARISLFQPELVVINTATASISSDLECAKLVKEVSPRSRAAAFGLHVTALPEEALLGQSALDYVIRGEPEFCLQELVQRLKQNEDISLIKGLSYRRNSRIIHNPQRPFSENLDTLPMPAWELVNTKNYLLPLSNDPFLLITTSKGCPHTCLFCPAKPYYGSILRQRPVKIVVDEMAYDLERFRVRNFLIWSESFTEDRGYAIAFCQELIKRGLKISWVCNSRVDKVDALLLKLMKEAGCWMIGFGIESAEQEILDQAKKGISVKQAEEAVRLSKEAGLEVTAHVLFGLPGETKITGRKTINWLIRQDIDYAQFYCFVPWPSTPLYLAAKEKGWLVTKDWRRYEQNYCVVDLGAIRPKQVEHLRKLAMRKFYLRPKPIFQLLKKLDSPRKLPVFFRAIREFISWL